MLLFQLLVCEMFSENIRSGWLHLPLYETIYIQEMEKYREGCFV